MGDEATSSACSRARLMPQTAQITEHDTRKVPVRDLVPADWNPRKISQRALDGLRASMERFGNVQPIVLNDRTGHIVSGHQRAKILAAAGMEETTVIVVDLITIARIAHHRGEAPDVRQ